jgi:hypothetical protein
MPLLSAAGVATAEASVVAAFAGCSRRLSIEVSARVYVKSDEVPTHLVHLGMVHLLHLCRTQVLHGVGVRVPWRHASHEGSSIHLRTRIGYPHVPNKLVRHAARARARLAWVMCHTRSHGMPGGTAWVLLHCARVWRKTWPHTSHHLQNCQLPTKWISTQYPLALSHAKLDASRRMCG